MAKKQKGPGPKDSSYSRKRKRGLVPYQYDPNSKSYQLGAHKHWGRLSDKDRMIQGRRDTQGFPARGQTFPSLHEV